MGEHIKPGAGEQAGLELSEEKSMGLGLEFWVFFSVFDDSFA